jgi:hypothetical protein
MFSPATYLKSTPTSRSLILWPHEAITHLREPHGGFGHSDITRSASGVCVPIGRDSAQCDEEFSQRGHRYGLR